MNVAHGSITFWGLEIPEKSLRSHKVLYRDECDHPHSNKKGKKKYNFCEECGNKRVYVETTNTELAEILFDCLIFAKVRIPGTDNEERKYYVVMEWYSDDVKILSGNITSKKIKRMRDFQGLCTNLEIWKKKRFGLYHIAEPTPYSGFYKNDGIKDPEYAVPAYYVDPKINEDTDTKVDNVLSSSKKNEYEKTISSKKSRKVKTSSIKPTSKSKKIK